MKNKYALLAGAGVIVFLAGIISLLCVLYEKKGGSLVYMGAELRNTIEIPLSEADSLLVDYGSKNLDVYVWQEDRIVIKEYLSSGRSDAKATVEYDGNRAVVTGGKWTWSWRNLFWGGLHEKIEVYLPAQGLKELELSTGSGNISQKEGSAIEAKKATVRAGSGNIRWQSAKAGEMGLFANSGNIWAASLVGDANIHTGSGNIMIKEISGSVEAKAGSGNVTIEALRGQCQAEAGSGNLQIGTLAVTGDITLHTRSGNQKLILPEDLSFTLQVDTGSGNIHTDYDGFLSFNKKGNQATGQIGDEPICLISCHAGSGNVTIKKD